jgi:hypothetical protein
MMKNGFKPREPRMKMAALLTPVLFLAVTHASGTELGSPGSARILEIDGRVLAPAGDPAPPPPVDVQGLHHGKEVHALYDGRFSELAPGSFETFKFFWPFAAQLGKRCPNLPLADGSLDMLSYMLATTVQFGERLVAGQSSAEELWLLALGAGMQFNEQRACHYDPSVESRTAAQERCDRATADNRDAAQSLVSTVGAAAEHDADLFATRYGCESPQALRMVNQLRDYSQEGPARLNFKWRLPVRRPGDDKLYKTIFDNCSRSQPGTANEWCACYVKELASMGPPSRVLDALATNPFVDGTYMLNMPGNDGLYSCAERHRDYRSWSDSHAPRTTACLTDARASDAGNQRCVYRAAWGKFSLTQAQCAKEISSKQWGYIEVDCSHAGSAVAPSAGPREWREGLYTRISYEQAVAPGFTPPLPADARAKIPLLIQLDRNEAPDALYRVALTRLAPIDLFGVIGAQRVSAGSALGMAIRREAAAMDKDGARLLVCEYKTATGGLHQQGFWYEAVPGRVRDAALAAETRPYFARIPGAATACPAVRPAS